MGDPTRAQPVPEGCTCQQAALPIDNPPAMNGANRKLLGVTGLLLAAVCAHAQAVITINFDNLTLYQQPGELYAYEGVHFSSGSAGAQNGVSNGDSGNWSLEGTNGAYYLGFNGYPGYTETITLDTATTGVELDVSRANGSSLGDTFTLTAYAGTSMVATQTVTLNAINTWQNVEVTGTGITKVLLSGAVRASIPTGSTTWRSARRPSPSRPPGRSWRWAWCRCTCAAAASPQRVRRGRGPRCLMCGSSG